MLYNSLTEPSKDHVFVNLRILISNIGTIRRYKINCLVNIFLITSGLLNTDEKNNQLYCLLNNHWIRSLKEQNERGIYRNAISRKQTIKNNNTIK